MDGWKPPVKLNRTLAALRSVRASTTPEMFAYDPEDPDCSDPPASARYMTLAEALALELKPLRLTVVSADKQLLAACRPAGLHIVNPEDD